MTSAGNRRVDETDPQREHSRGRGVEGREHHYVLTKSVSIHRKADPGRP